MQDLHNKEIAVGFYEERYDEGYMEEWDDLKKNKVREILIQINLPENGRALDFGCGNGVFTRIIKDVLPKWEVYGVEISKTAVSNATKKNPDCVFFGSEETEKYKHKFDFLFSHHVIEHVQDLNETFNTINSYLKPQSSQLHILPCGNNGSFEYEITSLKKNGIEKEKGNRFFYEEPGHLRRLTTTEFTEFENKLGFVLKDEFYSNQKDAAINWITKSSPRFVKKLTSSKDAVNNDAAKKLSALKMKLLPLTYLQFPYSKFFEIKTKWKKKISDYVFLIILLIPAAISLPIYRLWERRAATEWQTSKKNRQGSEMFLFYTR